MAWHSFKSGEVYSLDYVVAMLRKHIKSGNVIAEEQKEQYLQQIQDSGHPSIRYSPRGKGWGSSPLNPRNWRTPSGDPIYEAKS
jgi:hypothetical protein